MYKITMFQARALKFIKEHPDGVTKQSIGEKFYANFVSHKRARSLGNPAAFAGGSGIKILKQAGLVRAKEHAGQLELFAHSELPRNYKQTPKKKDNVERYVLTSYGEDALKKFLEEFCSCI